MIAEAGRVIRPPATGVGGGSGAPKRLRCSMKTVVVILSVLGGVLPLLGIGFGAKRVITEHRRLGRQLTEIDAIMKDPSIADDQKVPRAVRIMQPQFNYGRMTFTFEWIRYQILANAAEDLKFAAILTIGGILCGTAGSVWSLYLS
jgi:hypothetical protein